MEKKPLYFLEVVRQGDQPSWSLEDPELVSASQELEDGYVQFWAHPKESVFKTGSQPPCEALTRQYPSDQPALLVNQLSNGPVLLELLIVMHNHVWVRTESSIENLEDNVAAVLAFAKNKFNIKVEGFMTTDSVTEEVEEKMDHVEDKSTANDDPLDNEEAVEETPEEQKTQEDDLEEEEPAAEDGPLVSATPRVPLHDERPLPPSLPTPDPSSAPRMEREEVPPAHSLDALVDNDTPPEHMAPVRSSNTGYNNYSAPLYTSGPKTGGNNSSSKAWLLLPLAVLVIAAGGAFFFKDKIVHRLGNIPFLTTASPSPSASPEPTETPSPTPVAPTVDRSKYVVRVLNGTTKTGAAGTLADTLKGDGWQIDRTGNATNSAFPQTQIRIKKALADGDDVVSVIMKDLAPDLDAASSSSPLSSTDKADVEVVIGLK